MTCKAASREAVVMLAAQDIAQSSCTAEISSAQRAHATKHVTRIIIIIIIIIINNNNIIIIIIIIINIISSCNSLFHAHRAPSQPPAAQPKPRTARHSHVHGVRSTAKRL